MQYVTSAPETSKVPIVPMGKMLTYSPRLTLAHNCGRRSGQLQIVRAAETFNVSLMFPIVPWETQFLLIACRAVVSLSGEAQWPSHRAPSVQTQLVCVLMFKSSHSPDGKVADVLAPTHACTQLRPTLRSTTGCTCRRDLQCFPSPYGRHVWLVVCRAVVSMSLPAQ